MNIKNSLTVIACLFIAANFAQTDIPQDYLSSEFHKDRRQQLRSSMPENSVAIFFANPIRNRSNDVDFMYHQDPNFMYLTGYNEPHAMLLIFSEDQQNVESSFNELMYVQKKNARAEMWTGRRLGIEGTAEQLGFSDVFNGEDFKDVPVDFSKFDTVLFKDFENDVRDSKRDDADLYSLIEQFKTKVSYESLPSKIPAGEEIVEVKTNILRFL